MKNGQRTLRQPPLRIIIAIYNNRRCRTENDDFHARTKPYRGSGGGKDEDSVGSGRHAQATATRRRLRSGIHTARTMGWYNNVGIGRYVGR